MNTEGGKILMIDDDEDVLLAAKMLLKKQGHHIIIEKNPKKIPFLLNNDTYDVILLDMNFSKDITSGKEGFYWLEQILAHDASSVVIMITAFGDVEMAVRALKAGATDFILKPWQNEKLIATVHEISLEMVKTLKLGGRIYFCGNGGSAADAQHLAAVFTMNSLRPRSLGQLTPDLGDLLIALSESAEQ